jgi:hypothetical protein
LPDFSGRYPQPSKITSTTGAIGACVMFLTT